MPSGNPVKQEEIIAGWRRQVGRSGIVMRLAPQPGTSLQVTHTHTQVTPWPPCLGKPCSGQERWQAGLQTPFLWGGPLSLSMSHRGHSFTSSHEFHFLNDATQLSVNSTRVGTLSALRVFIRLPGPSQVPGAGQVLSEQPWSEGAEGRPVSERWATRGLRSPKSLTLSPARPLSGRVT